MTNTASTWRLGKAEHVRLADTAAPHYQHYASTSPATRAYMRFEADVIVELVHRLSRRERAVDLGCGDGRISFLLAPAFAEVRGYDMSVGMLAAAEQARSHRAADNVQFQLRDIEDNLLDDLAGDSVDLAVASFGMASFVENPLRLLRELFRVLRPGGLAMLSFYNADSLVRALLRADERSATLNALPDQNGHELTVRLGDTDFRVSARTYRADQVRSICDCVFGGSELRSYPTVAPLLHDRMTDPDTAGRLSATIDGVLGRDREVLAGAYLVASLTKPAVPDQRE